MHRSQLKEAPYNPRHIEAKARERLKNSVKKFGLVETIVWNERTGNIVGGHQRIGVLDSLEGTPDYSLPVAVVNLDDKDEKALNILLNNPQVQGEYELDKLESIFGEGVSWEDAGFSGTEVIALFGSLPNQGDLDADMLDKINEDMLKAQEMHHKIEAKLDDHEEFYLVFVGGSDDQAYKLIQSLGLDNSRWQDMRVIERLADLCRTLGATDEIIKETCQGVAKSGEGA